VIQTDTRRKTCLEGKAGGVTHEATTRRAKKQAIEKLFIREMWTEQEETDFEEIRMEKAGRLRN
jgi:hypothetical protein